MYVGIYFYIKNSVDVIFCLVNYPPLTSIFSTRVISGAKSTPDLNKLLERKQAGRMYILNSILFFVSFHFIFEVTVNIKYAIFDEIEIVRYQMT